MYLLSDQKMLPQCSQFMTPKGAKICHSRSQHFTCILLHVMEKFTPEKNLRILTKARKHPKSFGTSNFMAREQSTCLFIYLLNYANQDVGLDKDTAIFSTHGWRILTITIRTVYEHS